MDVNRCAIIYLVNFITKGSFENVFLWTAGIMRLLNLNYCEHRFETKFSYTDMEEQFYGKGNALRYSIVIFNRLS